MPRKVHYAARFQFFREAAFAVVRDRGVAALSRRALANELGIFRNRVDDVLRAEADLRVLAASVVQSRRTSGRFGLSRGEPDELALRLVCSLLPDAPGRVDEELVWLRLMLECRPAGPATADPDGPLWAQYQVADRGYVHTLPPSTPASSNADPEKPVDDPVDALAEPRSEREQLVTRRIEQALGALGVHAEAMRYAEATLRALIDGLTLAVCLGRLSPDQAVETAQEHLASLRRHDGRGDTAA
jgi:hypothetical protein